ncbi:MAG: hypothetical protein WBV81_23180 [Ignavibacteriaceae bacterium]
MTIRLTKKLADKLKIKLSTDYIYELNPIVEWYGHLFIANRIQYILFTNTYSLYSSIIPAKGILTVNKFIEINLSSLYELLKKDGLENVIEKYITPNLGEVNFYKTNNRGVLGSMNDMIFQSKYYLTEYNLSTVEISKRLNETIFGYIKYESPISILKQLISN